MSTAWSSQTVSASPRQGDDCLSDPVLDGIVAGEIAGESYQPHLGHCPRCCQRLALFTEMAEAERDIVARLVQDAIRASHQPRPLKRPFLRLRIVSWSAAALAAAATLALIYALPDNDQPPTASPALKAPHASDTIRIKGSTVRFFVKRNDTVRIGRSADVYQPADALRFVVTTSRLPYVLLLGLECNGRLSAYFPRQSQESAYIGAVSEYTLPNSLVLDDSPDTEYFLVHFSAEPVAVAAIREKLAQLQPKNPGTPAPESGDTPSRQCSYDFEQLQSLALPGQSHWIVINKPVPSEP